MEGVILRTVADLLGHATIQMTMRYAHLAPEHKLDAVNRLNFYSEGRNSGIVKRSRTRARSRGKSHGGDDARPGTDTGEATQALESTGTKTSTEQN